ncbi:hypothetical protein [Frateuria terrea]|uniref:DUF2622 domain-containing protein n=1 Tax=Frateuria terrea TaxID=529704 RepID=A0A1H6VG74_9GAMM|nr:hypothetical protein [Frateuria terrea]SEJ03553.1 hypothetical protein SAMN04487997_2277 [Frateuria terrea]SFP63859.1 hypothetical protein SAMN02927913_2953 [Frateuria terrea]
MPMFITRVELHDADEWEYYETLHDEMEQRGFKRTIRGKKGIYQLPTAEYVCTMSATASDVHTLAKQAANATGKKSSVISCEYLRAAFDLPEAGES